MKAVTFSDDPENFYVTYKSPARDYGNLREEFQNDAVQISKDYGPVYIAFSSGIDSQIIVRNFVDKKLDAEYVFLHVKNVNDIELQQLKECEKFFKIKVRIVKLDLEKYKKDWIAESNQYQINCISQFPFRFLSESLKESFPIITQGSVEPCIVGTHNDNVSVYHNYYEAMELRFSLMELSRKVLDFPYSSESVASYYTDDNLKTFASTLKYYVNNNLNVDQSHLFNTYAKAFVKGKYYNKDLIWFSKLTGYEKSPEWLLKLDYITETRVSVPYWDLVDFLENTRNEVRIYKDWNFKV